MDQAALVSKIYSYLHLSIRSAMLKCGIALISLQACRSQIESFSEFSETISRSQAEAESDFGSSEDRAVSPPDSSRKGGPHNTRNGLVDANLVQQPPMADFRQVAEQLKPSVVSVISTLTPSSAHQGKKNHVRRGIGSGLIVSSNGLVLTNDHVIASANRVDVELWNLERVQAKVLVADPLVDLALLRIDSTPTALNPIQWREAPADVGMWVISVGHPFGLGFTITAGIISGTGRDFRDLQKPFGLASRGYWSFLQTDASINLGNSGGPLVDLYGHVVGVTTAVRQDGQGIAFAIPAPMATRFMKEVRKYGRLRHPWLGIHVDEVGPDIYSRRFSCVRVTKVDPEGPAAKAGLQAKDLILSVNDQPLARASQLAYFSQLAGVGSTLELAVHRQVLSLSSEQKRDQKTESKSQARLTAKLAPHAKTGKEQELHLSVVIGTDK